MPNEELVEWLPSKAEHGRARCRVLYCICKIKCPETVRHISTGETYAPSETICTRGPARVIITWVHCNVYDNNNNGGWQHDTRSFLTERQRTEETRIEI